MEKYHLAIEEFFRRKSVNNHLIEINKQHLKTSKYPHIENNLIEHLISNNKILDEIIEDLKERIRNENEKRTSKTT